MKAYEATLTIDGKWVASATASHVFTAIDNVMSHANFYKAKNIKIEVKEIQAN